MPRGFFITFEGGEGSGKSTQSTCFVDFLTHQELDVVHTREPGGTKSAEKIRSLLLDSAHEWDPLEELFLLMAARRRHVMEVILPALHRGAVVVCDRFVDSTLVYQGLLKGISWDIISSLHDLSTQDLYPDLTFILDVPVAVSLERLAQRKSIQSAAHNPYDDLNAEFHETIRSGFCHVAESFPVRCKVVDGTGPLNVVESKLRALFRERFNH